MMPTSTYLNEDQISGLSIVYIVFLTPSLIGSLSVLVVSIARWKHLQEQVQPLVQLALADFLASLILMFTSCMSLSSWRINTNVTNCECVLPLSLTFYFISFLLVVSYALKSKNIDQGWRGRQIEDEGGQSQSRRRIVVKLLCAAVWLLPIGLYCLYVLTLTQSTALVVPANEVADVHAYCSSCILFLHIWYDSCSDADRSHDTFIGGLLSVTVICVLVSCSVIYYKVGKWYNYEQEGLFAVEGDGLSRRRLKSIYSTARSMILVIFICWTPALLLVALSTLMISRKIEQQNLYFLYIFQAITVSLQGFFNCVVYAWKRPNFRDAVLGETTPLVEHNRQAFFEESLRGPP